MGIISCRYGDFFVPDRSDLIFNAMREYGEWMQNEIDVLSKFIRSGDTVVDAGACIGTHARAFSQMVGSNGVVHAFEPNHEAYSILLENVQLAPLANIRTYNVALGATRQPKTIIQKAHDNLGSSTLYELVTGQNADTSLVIPLDELNISNVNFIKADVEGMEADILVGAKGIIQKCHPIIYLEINDLASANRCFVLVEEFGYRAFGFIGAAFNSNNFKSSLNNIFGNAQECGLLLVYEGCFIEFEHVLSTLNLKSISTIDDIAYLLARKPQYVVDKLRIKTEAWLNTWIKAQLFIGASRFKASNEKEFYQEDRSVLTTYDLSSITQSLKFVFPADLAPPIRLRLDIANSPAAITLHALAVHQADGAGIWRWDGGCSLFVNQVDMVCLPDDEGVLILSLSNDPRCELNLSPDVLSKIQGGCYLRLELTARPLLDALPGVLSRLQAKSEASLSVPVRPQLPASAAGQLAELGELLKTVVERKNATIESQKAEIQALQDRQNALYEQLVRAEAQLDLLKQLVFPEAGSRLERL